MALTDAVFDFVLFRSKKSAFLVHILEPLEVIRQVLLRLLGLGDGSASREIVLVALNLPLDVVRVLNRLLQSFQLTLFQLDLFHNFRLLQVFRSNLRLLLVHDVTKLLGILQLLAESAELSVLVLEYVDGLLETLPLLRELLQFRFLFFDLPGSLARTKGLLLRLRFHQSRLQRLLLFLQTVDLVGGHC